MDDLDLKISTSIEAEVGKKTIRVQKLAYVNSSRALSAQKITYW